MTHSLCDRLLNMNLQMVSNEFTAPSRALVPAAERAIPYSDNTFMCDMTTDSCVTSHVTHTNESWHTCESEYESADGAEWIHYLFSQVGTFRFIRVP